MASVNGFTADRMLQIEDSTVVGGFIDLSGHLILQRRDEDEIDAGLVKGEKGDPASYNVGGFSNNAIANYVRLGVLDGLNITNGAHLQFFLNGMGGIGTSRRGTVLVHATQRGTDVINLRAWHWGLAEAQADALRLYTRRLGDFHFEIWARYNTFNFKTEVTLLSNWNSTLTIDAKTNTEPSDLVQINIINSDLPERLDPRGQVVTDWNDAVDVGFYRAFGAANAPMAGATISVIVKPAQTIGIIQEASHFTTDPNSIKRTWRRIFNQGTSTWGSWQLLTGRTSEFVGAMTPTSGWSLFEGHPGGTPSGSPQLRVTSDWVSLRCVLQNTSGSTQSVSGGTMVATGLPFCSVNNYALLCLGVQTSSPGPPYTNLIAFMTTGGELQIRGTLSITNGMIINIVGMYPREVF